jgi:hypothetical protein
VDSNEQDNAVELFNGLFVDAIELRALYGDRHDVFRTTVNFKRKVENEKKFGEYSLLLRRITPRDPNKSPSIQLELQSDKLREVFCNIAAGCTSINLHHNPIIIPEPYRELYYYRDEICDAIETAVLSQEKAEIKLLTTFQEDFMSDMMKEIHGLTSTGNVTFDHLWSLFRPGTLVLLQNPHTSTKTIFRGAKVKVYEEITHKQNRHWELTVQYLGFDGKRVGMVQEKFTFLAFSGVQEITSLPVYPIQYHSDEDDLRKHLIERGRIYQDQCHRSRSSTKSQPCGIHTMYEGPFWVPESPHEARAGGEFYDVPLYQV